MSKPREPEISFSFDVSEGSQPDSVRIDIANGWVALLDAQGNEISASSAVREVTHSRPKGPKVRTRQAVNGLRLSMDGLEEMCSFHDVFVIDTCYFDYYPLRRRRALACSSRLRFHPAGHQVRVEVADHLVFYDLLNASGNPERAALLALIHHRSQSLGDQALHHAVVTDSDLGQHDLINQRAIPLYGSALLPPNFTLLYASGETGTETTNRVLNFCDRQARSTFMGLLAGEMPTPQTRYPLPGGGDLLVGRLTQTDVIAQNVMLGRATGPEWAELVLEGGGQTERIPIDLKALAQNKMDS